MEGGQPLPRRVAGDLGNSGLLLIDAYRERELSPQHPPAESLAIGTAKQYQGAIASLRWEGLLT